MYHKFSTYCGSARSVMMSAHHAGLSRRQAARAKQGADCSHSLAAFARFVHQGATDTMVVRCLKCDTKTLLRKICLLLDCGLLPRALSEIWMPMIYCTALRCRCTSSRSVRPHSIQYCTHSKIRSRDCICVMCMSVYCSVGRLSLTHSALVADAYISPVHVCGRRCSVFSRRWL